MKYIVGLGNPGEKYHHTRHNVGWMVLDALREQCSLGEPVSSGKYSGRVIEAVVSGEDVTLLYPDTYMNNSGTAVKKMVPKDAVADLIVVYDDIDLSLGEIKVSAGKGASGHNGVASIIDSLGSKEFVRVRVGVAPTSVWTGKPRRPEAGAAMTKHVLGRFSLLERSKLAEVLERAAGALQHLLTHDVRETMNTYN